MRTPIKESRDIIRVIESANTNKLTAVESFSGNTIANSYLNEAIITIGETIAISVARLPKSSISNKRDNIGEMSNRVSCANVAPVKRVRTFLLKSDLR
jgi:hypothetical protein